MRDEGRTTLCGAQGIGKVAREICRSLMGLTGYGKNTLMVRAKERRNGKVRHQDNA